MTDDHQVVSASRSMYRRALARQRVNLAADVACTVCGHRTTRDALTEPPYSRRILRGVYSMAPGDCYPDEYETFCPDCGANESFVTTPDEDENDE